MTPKGTGENRYSKLIYYLDSLQYEIWWIYGVIYYKKRRSSRN